MPMTFTESGYDRDRTLPPSALSTGRFRRTHGQSPRVLNVGTASGALGRRSRIDADDLHAQNVIEQPRQSSKVRPAVPGDIWLTFPDGTEVELKKALTIGRGPENDLTIPSSAVSRMHAELTFREGRWYIEDRGSYNGTFLNGTRVNPGTPLPLRHADRIEIGGESLLFSWPAQLEDPDTTEPLEEIAPGDATQLSSLQRRGVEGLCAPWLARAGLPS